MRLLNRILARLREFTAVQLDLAERRDLRDRPWEEEFLHWATDGTLHGHRLPPPGRHSTTRSGWCTGHPHRPPAPVVTR